MSYVFKDALDREWNATLTFGNIKRLKNQTGLDLLNADKPREGNKEGVALMTDLYLDVDLFLDTLYALCVPRDKQDQPTITRESFEDGFSGPVFEAAHNAFFGSLRDFFLSTHKEVLADGLDQQKKLVKACMDQGREQLQKLDLETRVKNEAAKYFGEQYSKLLESAESTPTA
jgi:hypothetical protein